MKNNQQSNQGQHNAPLVGGMLPYEQFESDEINLVAVWFMLVDHRNLIVAITSMATVVALIMAIVMTPIYRSEALLAQVSTDDSSRLSSIGRQFGGLAALAGISSSGASGGGVEEAIAIMKSREFLGKFIEEEQLMPVLFEDSWDKESNKFIGEDPPSRLKAYKKIHSIIDVEVDRGNGLITLGIEWTDAKQAAFMVNQLVRRMNEELRNTAIVDAERNITYLQKELANTNVVEVKQAIYGLIESQTKSKMLANTRMEHAFRVLDKAVVPDQRIKPKRTRMVITGFIFGVLAGVFAVFILTIFKNQIEKANNL